VISTDILGSLEYAAAVAGSKLIVVLGHTNCGAVIGACNHVQLGNLTSLLAKIEPATREEKTITYNRTGANLEYVNEVAKLHAKHSVEEILGRSEIISELVYSGQIGIIPAMYDIATGQVHFYADEAILWKQGEGVGAGQVERAA
jgi:carbonic anhydrase